LNAPQDTGRFEAEGVDAWFGTKQVLRGVNLLLPERRITAVIGPSGCGKSTFIRCLNRMHELVPGARVTGRIHLDGANIYAPDVDPVLLRRRVGMVFQKPNPFPTMSIRDNVLSGLRLTGALERGRAEAIVEQALRGAALWDEVKDRLGEPGIGLSGGSAAAPLHRADAGRLARGRVDGRALLGARSDRDGPDRGPAQRAQEPATPSSSSRTTCSRRRGSPIARRSSSPGS
jgi:ABC-type transporter Mla maintaining outer membrane lipid asymmetry ATPase subunit MlaF